MRLAPVRLAGCLLAVGLVAASPAAAHHTVDGILSGVHADYFARGQSSTAWRLDTGDARVPVLPTSLPALGAEPAEVAVEDESGGGAAVGEVTATASAVAAPGAGSRSLAVILMNFSSDTRRPWTTAQVDGAVFTGQGSLDAFYREESYGDIGFAGDVYGWYTLGADVSRAGCPWATWASKARQAAAADGFSAAAYQHVMYVFPAQSSCGWAGLAYVPGKEAWINGELSVRVMGHELGHNLGLHHAGRLECGGATISESCTLNEYGDPFDVMGAYGDRHSHSWHLEKLGVLGPQNIETASASGTYTIRSALVPTAETTTLRVPRRDGSGNVVDWYYLEIRERGGLFDDFDPLDPVVNGVSIRLVGEPGETEVSRLLDTHPATEVWDAALRPGETFTDGSVSVTTVTAGGGSASVRVTLAGGAMADSQAPSAPAGLTSTIADAGVQLSWSASSDDTGISMYLVSRDGIEVGTTPTPSYTDPAVPAGRHVYTVAAADAAGNRSTASEPHVVDVPGPALLAQGAAATAPEGSVNARSADADPAGADTAAPSARLRVRRRRHGRLVLRAFAADDRQVTRIELRIDGRLRRSAAGASVRTRWRPRRGHHRVVVRAYDASGNVGSLERRLVSPSR